jgi:hypothetical protein
MNEPKKRGRKRKVNDTNQGPVGPLPPVEAQTEEENEIEEANIDPLLQDDNVADLIGILLAENELEQLDEAVEVDHHAWNWQQQPIQASDVIVTRGGAQYARNIPPFRGPKQGPINIPRNCTTPLDFYRLLMDDNIINTLSIKPIPVLERNIQIVSV